uniref:BY PROTMAP: gi/472583985/gb/EMS21601.1/ ICE2 family protein [Rhodosporidium toruloides NP11] gi/647400374/emb/CDR45769.1/ RHTO0S11e04566g1_1 [Rhodosporidium toruloides] n=1 Tax=Rhodotorula toruloides TaxID=5286 RepID=A0A0K3C831_RHOTO
MASVFVRWARIGAHIASFAQCILYLPLTLDIAGKESMLALSLLLTLSFGLSATLHLIVRNTRLRLLSTSFAWLQPLLIPCLLLLTLNLYSSSALPPPSLKDKILHSAATAQQLPTTPSSNFYASLVSLARAAPSYWERFLRTSSPVFVILEGLCTLLCIQAVSRFTIARIEGSRSPDLLKMLVLVISAVLYVGSAYFLWESYGAVPDRISATLIGVAVTTIVFLSGISFGLQKGNVIETSLMLAYAVFQIFHLSSRPQMYTGGLLKHVLKAPGTNGHPPLPPVVLQSRTFGAGVEFVMAASSALPFSVLVTLFYRVAVLYLATRIVLALKRQTGGYEDNRKLSEEEPARPLRSLTMRRRTDCAATAPQAARVMTIVLAYARSLLVAVYTHLLLLSESNDQVFWRWCNVFLVQILWAIEIRLGAHMDEDATVEARWKTE